MGIGWEYARFLLAALNTHGHSLGPATFGQTATRASTP